MKRFFYFASMMLAMFMTYSCTQYDIPVGPEIYTIEDENGNKFETDLIATFTGEVGAQVKLGIGVYDGYDIYGVDFGDGIIKVDTVGWHNDGARELNSEDEVPAKLPGTTHESTTYFEGTVAGEGVVKVYGKSDIWYLNTSGNIIPESFDQKKLINVNQVSISGANVGSIELPAMEKMTQFHLSNVPVKSLDVSKATELTSLQVIHTSTSPYDVSPLESIDLSKNTKLTSLTLGGTFYKPGILTSIDLTQNTALETVVIANNKISEIKLAGQYNKMGTFNASVNELKSFDPATMPNVKTLDMGSNQIEGDMDIPSEKLTNVSFKNNKLTSIKVPNVTKELFIENNLLTLATIPAQPAAMNTKSKTKKFTYAPQAALMVPETVSELDLSSQLTVEKGELNPSGYAENLSGTTTYSFVTAGGTALVEGTDYEVTAPGKFKFIKAQSEKVHGVMLNSALPKFTAAVPFVTTEFTIEVK